MLGRLSAALRGAGSGVWRSLVARFVRDEEAVGSNPATPTTASLDPYSCSLVSSSPSTTCMAATSRSGCANAIQPESLCPKSPRTVEAAEFGNLNK